MRFAVLAGVLSMFCGSACEVPNPAYNAMVIPGSDAALGDDVGVAQEQDVAALLAFDSAAVAIDLGLTPDAPEPPDADVPGDDAALSTTDAAEPPVDAPVKVKDAASPNLDAATAPIPCPNDPALVACFGFEGSAIDESVSPIAINQSALGFENGPTGFAASSNANTRIVNEAVDNLSVTAVTIQAWIKPSALPATGARFGIVDYQPQYSLFVEPGGELSCGCDGTRSLTTAPLIKVGVWQSVACTMNSRVIRIWIDGVVRSTKNISGFCAAPLDVRGLAILGNDTSGGSPNLESFEGLADNVRIWRRARTATEICADALVCN